LSFLLDPVALLLIGFVVGRANYLTVVFEDRFLKRGASRRYIFYAGGAFVLLFWLYSSLLYVGAIDFPWPFPRWFAGPDWMLNSGLPLGLTRTSATDAAAVVVFATYPLWFYLGGELGYAGHRLWASRRARERDRILSELVRTLFPRGGAIPAGGDEVDAAGTVKVILTQVPRAFSEGFDMLLFVFDSRFLVFAFTGRWSRFVDLDPSPDSTERKRMYLDAWEANPYLITVAQILRVISGFGYFTKRAVYEKMGFDGPLEPGDPPWYVPAGAGGTGRGAAR
jgi:hypothetical protein